MKFGLPISFGLHAVFGLGGLVFLAAAPTPLAETRIIPVTIINIGEITNQRPAIAVPDVKPKPEIGTAPEPQVEPEPEPQAELQPTPKPIAEPTAEPAPEPEPELEAEAEPEPEPVVSEEASLETETETETEVEPEPEKPKRLSLDQLQALANRAKTDAQSPSEQRLLTAERNQIERAAQSRQSIGAGTALSTSYEDAIMRKVYNGWQIPSGAPNMESLIVTVEVGLDRDGKIDRAELTSDTRRRMRADSFYTAAAESALRAVNEASHFNFLPRDQYETWKSMTLTFYPQEAQSVVPT